MCPVSSEFDDYDPDPWYGVAAWWLWLLNGVALLVMSIVYALCGGK